MTPADVVADVHCIHPANLALSLDLSLERMGLESVRGGEGSGGGEEGRHGLESVGGGEGGRGTVGWGTRLRLWLRVMDQCQVDLLYLHNAAEMQLVAIGREAFMQRLEAAFTFLESE